MRLQGQDADPLGAASTQPAGGSNPLQRDQLMLQQAHLAGSASTFVLVRLVPSCKTRPG